MRRLIERVFAQRDVEVVAKHAATVFVGQIAVMGFGVVDTIVAGRHAPTSLAALSVGSAIFVTVYVSLMGLLQALLPIWSEMHGARRHASIGPSLRQSLYICLAASALGMVVLFNPAPLLRWTEVPPELQPLVLDYLAIVGWSLPAALLFRIFSTLSQALGKPQLVTWLQAVSLPVKLLLSVWFTFGGLGLAPMGVVGCAWGTFVVNFFLCGVGWFLLRTQSLYAPAQIWRKLERPHWPTLAQFAQLGVPASLSILVEITSFTLMALFVARMSTAASGAHQIAANVTALMYMVPLSLAIATSARASYWRGAGDEVRARQVAFMGLKAAIGLAAVLACGVWLGRSLIVPIYTHTPQVITIALPLLAWVSLYHLADATQTVSIFVLRSYRITFAPLIIYCSLLWGVGLWGGFQLAYHGIGSFAARQSPIAFWMCAAGALLLAAACFVLLLHLVTRKAVLRGASKGQ
ncbi:MATE family efflux transporter [Comamonas sp. J-3]|uniref:MATE family efflux transporter n=1 Tax=Comamonas trifloxystrobinivorans TaxID=3350256 RepID=UPI00372C3F1B